jgi:hypothetical protein
VVARRIPRPVDATREPSDAAPSRSPRLGGSYAALARMIARGAGNRALGTWLGRDPLARRALQRQVPGGGGSSGGTAGRRVVVIDGDPIIAVVARDSATEEMFRMNKGAKEISDKEWSVDEGIRSVRWLRLDQVVALSLVDEAAQREQVAYDEMMETVKDPSKRPDFGGPQQPAGDPDSLEWDRYRGEWRQKKTHR